MVYFLMNKNKISKKQAFALNVIFCFIWHLVSFLACISISGNYFNSERAMYQKKDFEKNGRWYKEKLKIHKWKDILPQHVGKEGFSKQNLKGTDIKYLNDFIYETCRGEWNHRVNSLFSVFALIFGILIKKPFMSIIVCILNLLGNLPFVAIQRYNRFRLITLKKRVERKQKIKFK